MIAAGQWNPPCVFQHIELPTGIGRACGRHLAKGNIFSAQEGFIEFLEALEGLASIEANRMDAGISFEQGSEIIALLVFYGRVKAAVPVAGADGIP